MQEKNGEKQKDIRQTWLSNHLQHYHRPSLAMPLDEGFNVHNSSAWSAYHDWLHRQGSDHYHPERVEEVDQKIWVVEDGGSPQFASKSKEQAEALVPSFDLTMPSIKEITLVSDLIPPIYGGPTLLEALWAQMDVLMERLMTKQDVEGDKYRAEQLGWVLAIVTNGYRPSMDNIRKEALARWKDHERTIETLSEEDDFMTRPEGADQ